MRAFSTNDLNKQVGEVTDAASKAPILITRHAKPRYVMMSFEHYERLRQGTNPQRSYAAGETPDHLARMFSTELDKLGGDDER